MCKRIYIFLISIFLYAFIGYGQQQLDNQPRILLCPWQTLPWTSPSYVEYCETDHFNPQYGYGPNATYLWSTGAPVGQIHITQPGWY